MQIVTFHKSLPSPVCHCENPLKEMNDTTITIDSQLGPLNIVRASFVSN